MCVCVCVCVRVRVCEVWLYLESMARAESRGSISRDEMSEVTSSGQNLTKLQMAVGE